MLLNGIKNVINIAQVNPWIKLSRFNTSTKFIGKYKNIPIGMFKKTSGEILSVFPRVNIKIDGSYVWLVKFKTVYDAIKFSIIKK